MTTAHHLRRRLHGRPVRHAVVGVGRFGLRHARAAASSLFGELVAVVDSDEAARRRAGEDFGVPAIASVTELIERTTVESVSVVLPHRVKSDVAKECLEAGLHVYIEKPLAIFQDTAQALVELAEHRGLRLAVGHQYRTFAGYQTLKHVLEEGTIGDVQQVLWTWHYFQPNEYFDTQPWKLRWSESGGGLVALQLTHDLDLLCWLFGPARSVGARLTDQLHRRGVEDSASAIIEFEQGALATLQASYNRPAEYVTRHIVGDRGMVVIERARSLTYDRGDEVKLGLFEPPPGSIVDSAAWSTTDAEASQPHVAWRVLETRQAIGAEKTWKRPRPIWNKLRLYRERREHLATIDSFFRAIRSRESLLTPARSALSEVRLRNAIVVSAVTDRFVAIPEDDQQVRAAYQVAEAEWSNR